jgi:ABC-type nitrate/sulfonate/bicarbonate transport system permease component
MRRTTALGADKQRLSLLIQAGVIVLFLVVWELAVRLGWIDQLFLASPIQTLDALGPTAVAVAPDLAATANAFAMAFVAGVLAALALGLAINSSPYWYRVLMPIFVVGLTVPKVTLLPLFILWFGIEKTTIVIYGALSAFFPMIVNVAAAGREVKPNQVTLARAMGYGRFAIYRKVIFPAMLPVLASGLFYACNAGLMGIFIVEMALARVGMGARVHDLAVTFKTGPLYAAVTLTALIAVVITMGFWYLARYFGRWRT